MKTWTRKVLHRHNSGTITLPGNIMSAADFSGVNEVEISISGDGILIRPVSSVLVTISGKPCYTWEEAAWAVEAERAKEQEAMYAEDGDGGVEEGAQNADHPETE